MREKLFFQKHSFVLFVLKIFILLSVFLFSQIAILKIFSPQYTHNYMASFVDKVERLESLKSPKIILVSNSNLAFGIQSDLIEEEIGLPVVNMGLHGGLGNAFHERMALFNIQKGDIIVISHLDYSDKDTLDDPDLALLAVENYFHLWKIFRLKDLPRVIGALPNYITSCIKRKLEHSDIEITEDTEYKRSSFNKYGDNSYIRIIPEKNPILYALPKISDECVSRINKFTKYCEKKGAHVVISGYPVLCGLEGFDSEYYVDFQQRLSEAMDCTVISDYRDYFFDSQYFYSGALHMTTEGAKLRTQQLISDLENYLESQK